ncbi:MAG: hypothetical protein SWC40_12240 [Thermodesulfobacteriota bacterium]|nr:hypothetical protein [Thermodesulfobacteriota bacterium]
MKRMKTMGASLCVAFALMTAFAGAAQAEGTPLGFWIESSGIGPSIVLVNFHESYSPAQIDAGTLLAQGLLESYGSSIQGTSITMYTPQMLSGIDADQLHNAILPVLGDLEMYLYVTATKVSHPESGKNLRFDLRLYAGSATPYYLGAVEVNEVLVNTFLQ